MDPVTFSNMVLFKVMKVESLRFDLVLPVCHRFIVRGS